jgi:hypothetical protein
VLAGKQDRANELSVTGADTGFAEPTHADELGQAARIVSVGLVRAHGQHAVGMPTVKADGWNITLMQPAREPSRGGSCFQANPDQPGRSFGKTIGDQIRIGRNHPSKIMVPCSFKTHTAVSLSDTSRPA